MELEINQRVLCLTFFDLKPVWLPGTVKHIMREVGHVTILIREDYRTIVGNNAQVVLPMPFVFPTISAADAWVRSVDKGLSEFVNGYDSSDSKWGKALTWQPIVSAMGDQLAASACTPPPSDSAQ